jgi:hypothetical protein
VAARQTTNQFKDTHPWGQSLKWVSLPDNQNNLHSRSKAGTTGAPCCLMSICPRRYSLPQMPDARVSWLVASFANACLGGALRLGPALVTVKVTSSLMRA